MTQIEKKLSGNNSKTWTKIKPKNIIYFYFDKKQLAQSEYLRLHIILMSK